MSSQTQDTKSDEVVASVRLPREQHEKLHEIAKSEHRTLSGHLRLLIDEHLKEAA